jgi:adenylyl cyclase-associated protein
MITLDKVDGCQIYLSKTSLNTEIITAKTSEVNVNVSGESKNFFIKSSAEN